jgi:glycosyltransferase involved in cell wall biosynthesis
MRILHITNVDTAGGTNTNCLLFIRASGAENTLLVLDQPGQMQERWRQCGLAVQYLNILNGSRLNFIKRLKEAAGSDRYDLILVWCCIRVPLIRYALRETGASLGIHLGNPKVPGWRGECLLYVQDFIFRTGVKTKLFSCSNHVKTSFHRGFLSRFENTAIYNPIEMPGDGEGLRPDANGSGVIIGMVARMDYIKDFPTLLRASALVRARGLALHVELLGDGPMRSELETLIEKLDLRSSVRLPGYVDNVLKYITNWNLFVYSTTEREGLGNSVVEALAAGVPCVASDLPMMHEIDDGKGLLVFFKTGDETDLADKIVQTLGQAKLRERMADLGRQHVAARHDPSTYAEKVISYVAG